MKQHIKRLIYGLLVIQLAMMVGCKQTNDKKSEISSKNQIENNSSEASNLLLANCYVCHNPNTDSHDEIIAPPLAGIKMRYMNETTDKEEFINLMSNFVFNPNEESALMAGPVMRFGIMPKTKLGEDDIRKIVTYIYENDLDEPSWFKEHKERKHR
ncbi:c-type cytochrome [Fulvivirga sp. 29W222]|uniref:C-type cytochrome n=1 Tax=Fulvivirga marina TaxID=2494733 RepID=A0A937FTI7_9BACT|nr:c-type cytochrome [Fulvivirga marina]MBL6445389.1 c-type cytochrome [Fulvivirga marina]